MKNFQSIKAILGPTNTGKTHLALERMVAHHTGMIGFPLRLLAKENYDRMVSIKGEQYVALITGEEKIIPPKAKWYSCTVEAMPTHIAVDFVAIDEIQLCADPDRGHIFTDRLLHCRGNLETIFLGADTITYILKQLIPEIEIENRPRLSSLNYDGFHKFTKLPSRCAIVAFSANEVYAIAEFIKRRHGGCAIVMGRLSPKTRNAQMELYQNKEVDYLVATDAIGMGLNMNVNHVAFASLSKYDGHQFRQLLPSEIAQIAGRAGRGMQDGTFGTTANCQGISEKIVNAVENHHFDPLQKIYWRNHLLDFTNPSRLITSLTKTSSHKTLITGNHATDLQTLIYLIQDPDIMAACTTIENTKLLWENCQIPDFKKLGNDNHARICKRIFLFLLKQGHVPETWINQQIEQLNHPHGDIDTLMQRLSGIRVCSYIATKNQWLENAIYWQAQTKEVEDGLSDALHTALTSRFVNQRATSLIRHLNNKQEKNNLLTSISNSGDILIEGQIIGAFRGFSLEIHKTLPPDEYKLAVKSIRKNIQNLIPQHVKKLTDSKFSDLSLDMNTGHILWENTPIGKLKKGNDLLHPQITLIDNDFLDNHQSHIISAFLQTYMHHIVRELCPLLFKLQEQQDIPALLRGILHQICENGGILWKHDLPSIPLKIQKTLKKHHIIYGQYAIYIKDIFKEKKSLLRNLLFHIYYQPVTKYSLPKAHIVYINKYEHIKQKFLNFHGWMIEGDQILRLDIAEKIYSKLSHRHSPSTLHKEDISPIPYVSEFFIPFLKQLNFYIQKPQSISSKRMGPPTPLLVSSLPFQVQKKRLHKQIKTKNKKNLITDNPFSALQTLYKHD